MGGWCCKEIVLPWHHRFTFSVVSAPLLTQTRRWWGGVGRW